MEATENTRKHQSPGTRDKRRARRSPVEARRVNNGDGGGITSKGENSDAPKLYHTLTACTRCRSRKTRCDAGLPKCGPCERSRAHCEFFDSTKQKTLPRSYVVHLQAKIRDLENELRMREALLQEAEEPDLEELVRGVGLVKFGDDEHYKEPRYVGSSSGVTVTRLVLESAKKSLEPEEFRNMTADHQNMFKFAIRSLPDEESYPRYKSLPATKLPAREITDKLVGFFCQRALFILPVLHEPTFIKDVADVYAGSTDPYKQLQLKVVLAISMQKLSIQYAGLADSYFLAGLQHLEQILETMDHRTLQCLLCMVQYALVTPAHMPVYHLIGIAVRLCMQLGYHQERTIMLSETPLNPIDKDMRRRLFWSLASMEYGLSHVLGRPSAFATADAYVDVGFYQPVDDIYITAEGILPAPVSAKKLISMHFFRMRRLQATIRQTLYQNPRESPKSDKDPWFYEMHAKLGHWRAGCPQNDLGSGLNVDWFDHRYDNMLIFMYRPSPQIPQPSLEATLICFNSATKNIILQRKMFDERAVDFTWVFMYQIYTVTLTLIWALYNEGVRERHPREEVERYLEISISSLTMLAERWPGTEAAVDLFSKLAQAAMQSYVTDRKKFSPTSPPPSSSATTTTTTTTTSKSPTQSFQESFSPTAGQYTYPNSQSVEETTTDSPGTAPSLAATYSTQSTTADILPGISPHQQQQQQQQQHPEYHSSHETSIQEIQRILFGDPNTLYDMLPPEFPPTPLWDSFVATTTATNTAEQNMILNQQEQQSELMSILEHEAMQGFDVARQGVLDLEYKLYY